MSVLDRQIRHVRARMTTNVLLRQVAFGLIVASLAWLGVILVERAFAVGIPLWPCAAAAAAVGLIVVAVGVYQARVEQLAAAVVLDEAAGLKERVSTALTCRQSTDPFAQATVHDAEKTAGGVHVPSHVRYRAPGLWPWSLATVIVAVIFFEFMPQLDLLASEAPEEDGALAAAAIEERQNVEVALQAQMRKVKQRLQDKPALASLQEEIEKLELPNEPTRTPEDVRREAVKKIEKVSDKLKQRIEADDLKSLDQLKRELAKLETPEGDDAGSKLTEALASGDMEAAKKAMGDLKKMLEEAAKSGDAQAKQKLADMQQKLDNIAKQLNKLGDQDKLLKDLENKGGLSEEQARKLLEQLAKQDPKKLAEELQKRLAESGMTPDQIKELAKKIAQNQKVREQLKSMAQAMAQSAQACKQCQQGAPGESGAAAMQGAMEGAMGQLSELEMAEQMANELEAQLAELEDLKAGVCEGNGMCPGQGDPNKIGQQGPQAGYGYGSRIGKQRGAHGLKASKAKTRTQGGQIIGQMLIDGPQVKGEATAEVTEAVNSAVRDAEDAVEREEIPRQYQRVVQLYFERLAGLMSDQPEPESEAADNEGESESDNAAPDDDQPE